MFEQWVEDQKPNSHFAYTNVWYYIVAETYTTCDY